MVMNSVDVLNLLVNFSNSNNIKEYDDELTRNFFSHIMLLLIKDEDKYELCKDVNNYLFDEVIKKEEEYKGDIKNVKMNDGKKKKKECDKKNDGKYGNNLEIIILFIDCLFKKCWNESFFNNNNNNNIDISWVYKLFQLKGGEKNKYSRILLNLLKNILIKIQEENPDFSIIIFLLKHIQIKIQNHIKENQDKNMYLFYEKWKNKLTELSSKGLYMYSYKHLLDNIYVKNQVLSECNEDEKKNIIYNNNNDDNNINHNNSEGINNIILTNKQKRYKNLLSTFDLNFEHLCALFVLYLEEVNGNQNYKTSTFQNEVVGLLKNEISKEHKINIDYDDESIIMELINYILYHIILINDKDMRNILIKDFSFAVKEYIYPTHVFTNVCLNIIDLMYFFLTNDMLEKNMVNGNVPIIKTDKMRNGNHNNINNNVDMKKDDNVEETIQSNDKKKVFIYNNENECILDIYYKYMINMYNTDINIDEYLLNDIYNFIILYIDYIYNEEFVKNGHINDIRYYFLLFNKGYMDENVLKKLLYIFNTVINICRKTTTKNGNNEMSLFIKVWEHFECIVRCIENFSVHLLKSNWFKIVELINIVSSIKVMYEKKYEGDKNISDVYDEYNKDTYIHRNHFGKNIEKDIDNNYINTIIHNNEKILFFDYLDFYIFQTCVKRSYNKMNTYMMKDKKMRKEKNDMSSEINFVIYIDYIILKLNEYLIWLLILHKNDSVIRYSLCGLLDYENKKNLEISKILSNETNAIKYTDDPLLCNDKKESDEKKIHILTFINSICDHFLFNIFFMHIVKPTLFIKGDMLYYESRIKNFIMSKILYKYKYAYNYLFKFIISLGNINYFYINLRIILETLLQ